MFTRRKIKSITNKANKKETKEFRREAKSVIRTLKADVKKAAKKGVSEFRCKVRNTETYETARLYFISKGFRAWNYTKIIDENKMEEQTYMAIQW